MHEGVPEVRGEREAVRVSHDRAWDFHGCRNTALMTDPKLREWVNTCIKGAGFTVLKSTTKVFPGEGGVSVSTIIGESGVEVHTWPETGTVHITIHYCDFTGPNDMKARELYWLLAEGFNPEERYEHPERCREIRAPRERFINERAAE